MIMDLSRLFEGSERFLNFSGKLDQSKINFTDRDVKFDGPIIYKADFFVLDDGDIEFKLEIDYSYEEACSRCLKPTKNSKTTTLSGKLLEGREEDFIEEEGEFIFYENNELKLEEYVESQVYVSLPMRILCEDDCKGLCSTCGINLNENTCDCVEHTIDPRLADLQKFFPKE